MGQPLPPEQLCFSSPVAPSTKGPRPAAAKQTDQPVHSALPVPAPLPAMPAGEPALKVRNRWHSIFAVGLVLLAALAAAGIWSYVTPHGEGGNASESPSPPFPSRPAAVELAQEDGVETESIAAVTPAMATTPAKMASALPAASVAKAPPVPATHPTTARRHSTQH